MKYYLNLRENSHPSEVPLSTPTYDKKQYKSRIKSRTAKVRFGVLLIGNLHAYFRMYELPTTTVELERYHMAKKNNSWSKDMVNITLTQSDKPKFDKWVKSSEFTVERFFLWLAEKGYKVSIKFNSERVAYSCSLIGTDEAVENTHSIMSSWSDDAIEAMAMSIYKAEVICDGGAWADYTSAGTWG